MLKIDTTSITHAPLDPQDLEDFRSISDTAVELLHQVDALVSRLQEREAELHANFPTGDDDDEARKVVRDLSGCAAAWAALHTISQVARG